MDELADLARRLRAVRQAREECAIRWLIERYVIGPMLLDRVNSDLRKQGTPISGGNEAFLQMRRGADDEAV